MNIEEHGEWAQALDRFLCRAGDWFMNLVIAGFLILIVWELCS